MEIIHCCLIIMFYAIIVGLMAIPILVYIWFYESWRWLMRELEEGNKQCSNLLKK